MRYFLGNVLSALVMVVVLGGLAQPARAQLQIDRGDQLAQEAIRAQMELHRFEDERRRGREQINKSRNLMFWAPLLGLTFFGFLAVATMYRRRMTLKSSAFHSGEAIATEAIKGLTQSFTTGKQTTEEVGQAVIEALRMGTYANYRRLFPTPREVDTFMAPERSKAYKQQVLTEEHLRACFKRLHEVFFDAQGHVERFEAGAASSFAYGADPSATLPSIGTCALAFRNGQSAVVGSLVQLPTGWRLLVPG